MHVNLGSLPTTDLTIAAGKSYTFIFSTWSTESAIRGKLAELSAYANGADVKTSGLTTATVILTPLYNMPLSAWQTLFGNIGLNDMKDMYVGGPATTSEGFHPVDNVVSYWEPKIESAVAAIKAPLGSAFSYVKYIAIAGAVIAGSVVVLTYLPKPKYNQNPKKRHRRR